MPRTRDLAERAEYLSVGLDMELAEVHEELIRGLNLQLQAFSEVVAAIDTGDYSRITSANRLLSLGRKIVGYVERILGRRPGNLWCHRKHGRPENGGTTRHVVTRDDLWTLPGKPSGSSIATDTK